MGQPAKASETLSEFVGQVSHANPHQIPSGAAVEQTNIMSTYDQELKVREGYRLVTFEV